MSLPYGAPVKSAVANAAFPSRTNDTTLAGKVDFTNTTQSTDKDTGAVTVQGGVGIEKNLNVGGNVVIGGNLTVTGKSIQNLDVEDANITINKGGNDASAEGAGLTVERTGTNGSFIYADALASKWKLGTLGSESEVLTAGNAQTISSLKTFTAGILNQSFMRGDIVVDSTSTGSNVTIATPSKMILKVTNASLGSISKFSAPLASQMFILINGTGASILINNTNAASDDILTGTGANLTLDADAMLWFVYDSNSSRWRIAGGTGGNDATAIQEIPSGTVNGTNDTFTLSYTPTSVDSLLVTVDGVVRKKTSEWGLSGNQIVFTAGNIPAVDQEVYVYYNTTTGGNALSPATEFRTITPTEVTNKKLVLAGTPNAPSVVLVDHIGGTSQEFGVDYTIVGNELQWNGYALDGVIVSGYKLRIHYFT